MKRSAADINDDAVGPEESSPWVAGLVYLQIFLCSFHVSSRFPSNLQVDMAMRGHQRSGMLQALCMRCLRAACARHQRRTTHRPSFLAVRPIRMANPTCTIKKMRLPWLGMFWPLATQPFAFPAVLWANDSVMISRFW